MQIMVKRMILFSFIFILSCNQNRSPEYYNDIQSTIYEMITARWDLTGINEYGYTRKPVSESFIIFERNLNYSFLFEDIKRVGKWTVSDDGRRLYLDSGTQNVSILELLEINEENLRFSTNFRTKKVDLRFEMKQKK